MPIIDLSKVPGYVEAVERQQLVRDSAFLEDARGRPVTEYVCGMEFSQMTLRKWVLLRMTGSALLTGGTPSPEQLAVFCWVASVGWNPEGRGRRRFLRSFKRRFIPPTAGWFAKKIYAWPWKSKTISALSESAKLLMQCRRYLADTFQDMPTGGGTSDVSEPSYYSDAAFVCAFLCKVNIARSDSEVLDMPLKRVFQYLKFVMATESGQPLSNPSDSIVQRHIDGLNANHKPETVTT